MFRPPLNGPTGTCRPSSPFVFCDERGPIWKGGLLPGEARYAISSPPGRSEQNVKQDERVPAGSRYGKIMIDAVFLDQVKWQQEGGADVLKDVIECVLCPK